jgi:Trypsin-like peptidase domain/NACHT domain
MEHLYDLLEQCTVKLTIGQSQGTGFFVAPGFILTCNHVVCGAGESSIEVVWNNQKNSAQAKLDGSFPDCDLALLKVDLPINVEQPCVYLGEEFRPRDKLYLFGYSNEFPDGCPVTIDCEGEIGGDLKPIKFKLGNVRPGMSGSPLLNERTGYVCGIVKFNLLDGIPGGGAVATSVILDKFPDLLELQQSFHQQDRRWNNSGRERDINWHTICNDLLTEHRRQLSSNPLDVKGKSFDDVYVPLGLVERKEKQRPQIDRNLDPSADRGSELYRVEVETTPIEHDDFLQAVCDRQPGEHIVILGEPGAGKTTLLTRVWESLLAANPEAPSIVIWVPLAALGSRSLEEYVEESWLRQVCEKEDKPAYLASLTSLRQAGKLYLLLDGADEIGGDGLKKIEEYLLQSKWAKPIKAVVTCRLNLWDGSDQNKLKQNFQIFRTLDFKYVNSVGKDEVEAFILNWFDDDTEAGRKLRMALDQTGKERIKDLAQNPLRLTLLCNIWQEGEGLPDTQARLYEQFVKYIYEWSKVPDAVELQFELDRVMGTLAKYGINKPSLRFRFTEDELQAQVPDLKDRKALKDLGWLNCVGAENRTKIYAFFHPTFQEYFAACNIDDSDYFLPKEHVNCPINCQNESTPTYRIFEKQWQQVILLWIGRHNLDENCKDDFLKRATNFNDKESGIFFYISYCLAASYLSEFKKARQNLEITNKFSRWIAHDDENLNKSELIGFIQSTNSSELNYTSHVFKCLYELLVEIDKLIKKHGLEMFCSNKEAKTTSEKTIVLDIEIIKNQRENILNNLSVRSKISQRDNILKIFKLLPHLTTELYEYCWNFAKTEQLDLGSAYVCYQIIVKHAASYNILSASVLTNFKGSERYREIRKFGPKNNKIRRQAARIKETSGFTEKNRKIEILFEKFSDSADLYYRNEIISVIADGENYSLYDVKQKILNAIQRNQALLEYLCELIDSSENREIKYQIATSLDIIDSCRIGNINKLLRLIEDVDSSRYLRRLLEKLHNVVFEDILFEDKDEKISEETKEKIVKYLIGKLIREADERCFVVLSRYVRMILTKEIIPFLISKLKIQLTDETFDPQKIEGYYYLIAYCAQTLSYPEFYDMWHQSDDNLPPRNH